MPPLPSSSPEAPLRPWARWARFAAVGLAGIVVQVATLVLLADYLAVNLVVATVAAVAAAVVHNFVWHLRWTWSDRRGASVPSLLVRFASANGLVAFVGNGVLVSALVEGLGVPTVAASLVAIAACAVANYALADRLVFTRPAHAPSR